MDPEANLAQIRKLLDKALAAGLTSDESDTLAQLVEALDVWMSRGGHLPRAWLANR